MGLGNFDIASFKPKRSETAVSLLAVAPQQDTKKTERLELRIRSDVLMRFVKQEIQTRRKHSELISMILSLPAQLKME